MDYRLTIEPIDTLTLEPGPSGGETDNGAIAFEAGRDEVIFGREPTSDVVFPPTLRIVSRRHFRLYRQVSGHYAIEVFGDRYVEVNGAPARSGEAISDGDVIRLGSRDGPAFRVRLTAEAPASDLEKTLTQVKVASTGAQFKRLRRVVAAVVVAIVVVGVGAYVLIDRQGERLDALATLQQDIEARVASAFDETTIDAIRGATYAVVAEARDGTRTLLGTAWPVGDGKVATNAHVAAAFDPNGGRVLRVVHPGGGESHTVTGAWVHPGYAALKDFRAGDGRADPDFRAAFEGLPQPSGFDVAILDVDRPDALHAPLSLATADDLKDFGPGERLAYAGYPIEGTTAERAAAETPEPLVKFGYASSLTDFFLFATDPGRAYLVRHSIPATGGASGSPIFNEDGRVVAVLSGGTVFDAGGVRQPSAVLENYAQRVDLLEAGLGGAGFDVVGAVTRWKTEVLPRFRRHRQQIYCDTAGALQAATGGAIAEALRLAASLKDPDTTAAGPIAYREHSVDVTAGQRYGFLAYGEAGRPVSVLLMRDGKPLGFAGTGSSFATIDYPSEAAEQLTVRILGEKDAPVDYELFVLTNGSAGGQAFDCAG
ncbi:trypsin-like peptidase domain-containing protein [Bauldia sp.]|uniref:trypsin-like peptidase domain-containing protein n=1 Tax=Bauldia sp. TaxID=2575872 RepID=UPI003BAA1585